GPVAFRFSDLGEVAESSTSLISLSLLTSKTTLLPSGTKRTSLSLPGFGDGLRELGLLGPLLLPDLVPESGPELLEAPANSCPRSTCSVSLPRPKLKTPSSFGSGWVRAVGVSCG